MARLEDLFLFDPERVTIRHCRLADWLGMNFTIGRYILLTAGAWRRYQARGKRPDGLIYHEYRHYLQQRKVGLVRFLLLYLLCLPWFWNPWRKRWELEAYRISMAWRLHHTGRLSRAYKRHLAEVLSSYKYGWMMRRGEAEEWVERTAAQLERLIHAQRGSS